MNQTALMSYINRLTDFQKERLIEEIMDFIEFNDVVQSTHYLIWSYCGVEEPRIIKKGFLNGKQRVQYQQCNHKSVHTLGKLRYNSHQSETSWTTVILDTLNAVSLLDTAAKINCSADTVFHMRHKFLLCLQTQFIQDPQSLEGIIEMDETYVSDGAKGIKWISGRKARKHGESAEKRGLSEKKLCIFVGSNRLGAEIAHCVNRAKPTS